MQRFFIQLSYRGTAYHGWQIQENTPSTVQQVLNEKLSLILGENIAVTGCGRTDTGVHAKDFYAHFDLEKDLAFPADKLAYKLNAVLPHDIVAARVYPVHPLANARYDALSRTYEYHIIQRRDPFLIDRAFFHPQKLDIDEMNKAAALLYSYNDFSAFSKSNTQTQTNVCKLMEAGWKEQGELLVFRIKADRFLRNMVRAIVGTLLEVGEGHIGPDEFKKVVESKDRAKAGFSVPACGLYLVNVEYPEELANG
jgi:tRNA pseudouridine38-40 synthase